MSITELDSEVIVLGDIHGNMLPLERTINYAIKNNIKSIIQIGDFGVDRVYSYITNKLVENEITLYFIAGNHEHWDVLDSYVEYNKIDNNKKVTDPVKFADNVFYLPTGAEINIGDKTAVVVGGAASIDKNFRTPGYDWFPQETISDNDVKMFMNNDKQYDIIFSHDAPQSVDIPEGAFTPGAELAFGKDILKYCENNRYRFEQIYEVVQPEHLFHGHYHYNYELFSTIPGTEKECSIYGLDMENKKGSALAIDFTTGTKEYINLRYDKII